MGAVDSLVEALSCPLHCVTILVYQMSNLYSFTIWTLVYVNDPFLVLLTRFRTYTDNVALDQQVDCTLLSQA